MIISSGYSPDEWKLEDESEQKEGILFRTILYPLVSLTTVSEESPNDLGSDFSDDSSSDSSLPITQIKLKIKKAQTYCHQFYC